MSRRSKTKFKQSKGDFYRTPEEAVLPLLPHLPQRTRYSEPTAGDGALIDVLAKYGHQCVEAYDLYPKRQDIKQRDFFDEDGGLISSAATYVITNPPWTRSILHPMIDIWSAQTPTWLLFQADWMHTLQARPYLEYCHKIVSVGRVSWMFNGNGGLDNASWYLFWKEQTVDAPKFVKRQETLKQLDAV